MIKMIKIKKVIKTIVLAIGFIAKWIIIICLILFTFGNYATWRIAYKCGIDHKKTNLLVKAKRELKLERQSKRINIKR